jgi:glutamyl-tRNA(Gln) amidotransferase subunit E
VKRGLSTIRQDVNVSIRGGARVEIKGVQDLNLVSEIVRLEALRQVRLLEIRDELLHRKASADCRPTDVTSLLASTKSKVIARSLKEGGIVLACIFKGFNGLIGSEIQPDRRLGSEISERAKRAGVGGIFHTDELPAYGITAEAVSAVRNALGAGQSDAVIMVTGTEVRAKKAMEAVISRAKEALMGVPEETRRALSNGASEYMRPLPGRARMYPETDVPSVVITEEMLQELKLPELFTERAQRYEKDFGLNNEMAKVMASSPNYQLFEEIVAKYDVLPSLVVRTLETVPIELAREKVPVANLVDRHFCDCLVMASQGKIAKEGISSLLKAMAENPKASSEEAAKSAGLAGMDESGVESVIHGIVIGKADLVKSKGERASGPLMGLVMKELRGRADGALVSAILKKEIQNILNE